MKAIKLALLALVSAGPLDAAAQSLPGDAATTCVVAPAQFSGWFVGGSVSADGAVNPADSLNFPNVPNCSFYQWSEQMFLWLNSPAPANYGGGGGRVFDSPTFYDVSVLSNGQRTFLPHVPGRVRVFNVRVAQVGPHGLPAVVDPSMHKLVELVRPQSGPNGKTLIRGKSGAMVEVERFKIGSNGKPLFLDKAGKTIAPKLDAKGLPVLNDANGKPIQIQKILRGPGGRPIFIDGNGHVIDIEQGQAGGGGVLMAQNGSLVYYAMQVNDVYAYFTTGAKDGGITPTPTQFPTTQTDLTKIVNFAQQKGKTFPDPNALAVEVKSAWIEASGLDTSKYITMKAVIPTYDTSNPAEWKPNGSKEATLVMMGMHVVGSTAGHPEMIWATFEHEGNTPLATYSYNSTGNPSLKTVQASTAGNWLFAATNSAAPFNVERMDVSQDPPNIKAESGQTIGPSNTQRLSAWGDAGGTGSASKNTEVISINNSVLGQLAAGDVRKNYQFVGATWTIFGAPPSGSNQVGTNLMSNSTLETYQQPSNCFDCHVGNPPNGLNPDGISHIFGALQPLP
ncbi:MAG: hypothetical protein P4L83_18085 [Nevskia sp.]|nr:hypothetical protein [Nevskia sp.]